MLTGGTIVPDWMKGTVTPSFSAFKKEEWLKVIYMGDFVYLDPHRKWIENPIKYLQTLQAPLYHFALVGI